MNNERISENDLITLISKKQTNNEITVKNCLKTKNMNSFFLFVFRFNLER